MPLTTSVEGLFCPLATDIIIKTFWCFHGSSRSCYDISHLRFVISLRHTCWRSWLIHCFAFVHLITTRWIITSRQWIIASRHSIIASRHWITASRRWIITSRHWIIASRRSVIASRRWIIASRRSIIASRRSIIASRRWIIASRLWIIASVVRSSLA